MGKILINLKVSNFGDIFLNKETIRAIEIENAMVDTGVTMLSLHKHQIDELGLKYMGKIKVRTANGSIERNIYGVARVEIMGRAANFDVMEIPDDVPVLVGYLILEQLDFVPDPNQQKLIPNPAHDGEYALDMYPIV
jgi:predicted aspartyl protease